MANSLRGSAIAASTLYSEGGGTVTSGEFDVQPQVDDYVLVNISADYSTVVPTVTDNAGNTYAQVGSTIGSGIKRGWMFRAKVTTADADLRVTATFTGSETEQRCITCAAVDGADTTTPGGVSGGQVDSPGVTGADNTTTGSLGTPSEDGHFFFGMAASTDFDCMTLGTGWTALNTSTTPTIRSGYQIQGTAAAFTGLFTNTSTTFDNVVMVQSIRPATGGGGSITFDEDYQLILPVQASW